MLRTRSSSTSEATGTHSDYALYLLANNDFASLEAVQKNIKGGNAVLLYPDPTSTSSSSLGSRKYKASVIQNGKLLEDDVEMDNQKIDATPSCTIPLSTPQAAILVKMALKEVGIIVAPPYKKAKSFVSIDLQMCSSGKNIIKPPDASRTSQNPTAKLKYLSNIFFFFSFSREEIWSCLDAKDSTHALANLSTSCVTLYQQTERIRQKRALEQLLQAMLDHNRLKVSSILMCYPEFLLAKPEDYNIKEVESRFTWLRYLTVGESVFSMAQKLLLVDMLEIMLPHFLKQLDDAERVPDAKHRFLELKKQWILPALTVLKEKKREIAHKKQQEKYTQDYLLTPIKALAADTTIQVSWEENPETERYEARIEHISPTTVKALDDLRTKLFEPKAIQDCIDINQLLIAAYYVYDNYFDTFQNRHRRNAFAILVIGFIQGLVNPSLGKAYCEELYGVAYQNKEISPRAESLVRVDGRPFYRASRDSHVGQGFNFLCSMTGVSVGWQGPGESDPLEIYVKQIYQSVMALRNECTLEANPRSRQGHHRTVIL